MESSEYFIKNPKYTLKVTSGNKYVFLWNIPENSDVKVMIYYLCHFHYPYHH